MNHPAEYPEPVHEWHEVNWLPKNLPFSENPGPLSDAAALDSIVKSSQVELYCHSTTCVDILWDEMSCLTGPRCYINTDIQHEVKQYKPIHKLTYCQL